MYLILRKEIFDFTNKRLLLVSEFFLISLIGMPGYGLCAGRGGGRGAPALPCGHATKTQPSSRGGAAGAARPPEGLTEEEIAAWMAKGGGCAGRGTGAS